MVVKGLMWILESRNNKSESWESPGNLFLKKVMNPNIFVRPFRFVFLACTHPEYYQVNFLLHQMLHCRIVQFLHSHIAWNCAVLLLFEIEEVYSLPRLMDFVCLSVFQYWACRYLELWNSFDSVVGLYRQTLDHGRTFCWYVYSRLFNDWKLVLCHLVLQQDKILSSLPGLVFLLTVTKIQNYCGVSPRILQVCLAIHLFEWNDAFRKRSVLHT